MTGRERVERAIAHEPGPVPLDFGTLPVTGFHVSIVEQLRAHYGMAREPVRVIEPYQMLGEIADDLRDALGVDTVPFWNPATYFGYPLAGWKEWRAPWGQDVLVPGGFHVTPGASRELYTYPQGDTNAPPSAVMPEGGFFFDTIIRQEPFDEDDLDPEDNLEEFGLVSDDLLAYYRECVPALASSGRYVVARFGGTALGDIAAVPAPQLAHPRGIRDVTEWYVSIAARQGYVHRVFDRQTEIALANLERIHAAVGDVVGAINICGTDFGTQKGPLISPETFRDLYVPYYNRVAGWIHSNTNWKVFKHSCGGIEPILGDLIEAGFDIINPVQVSAEGMEAAHLKERYGDRIVFWGGGVDTQKTLPFGAPADVREEVLARCRTFAAGGGFVFNAIHNVQAKTPVENVVAMIDAVHEYNRTG